MVNKRMLNLFLNVTLTFKLILSKPFSLSSREISFSALKFKQNYWSWCKFG